MRAYITKSRSGHYTVTMRVKRHPDLKVTEEKIGDIEQARRIARVGGPLWNALKRKIDTRENPDPLPDYKF